MTVTECRLSSYWVNISDNTLIRDLLLRSSPNFKAQFELLLEDKSVEAFVDEHLTFNNLEKNESAIWSLLLMSGYLKAKVVEEKSQGALCQLQIPNYEVKDLYRTLIAKWLSGVDNPTVFNNFIENLLSGKVDNFSQQLHNIMLQSFSVYDVKGKEPEKFFHGFMLGLVSCIEQNEYMILSNQESGYGRFDIMIIPREPSKLAVIIEVKSIEQKGNDDLKVAAGLALNQIEEQKYETMLKQHKIKRSLKIGVAFSGKNLFVKHKGPETVF